MENNRVYLENIQWNVSRSDLVEMLGNYAGSPHEHLQIIRKGPPDETWPGRKCSAIVTFATHQQAISAMVNLNKIPASSVTHILALNQTSFRAKPAFFSGAKSIAVAKARGSGYHAFPPPPPPPPPLVATPPNFPPPPSAYVGSSVLSMCYTMM